MTDVRTPSPTTGGWGYGEEGARYPVRIGEVWRCGEHLFACSDLMASKLFDELIAEQSQRGRPARLVYVDPPWGQANLNSFQTKAGLERASYDWTDLYRRIADLGHLRGIPLWMEGGVREKRTGAPIPAAIEGPGTFTAYWELVYYRRHPMGLYYSAKMPPPSSLLGPDSPLNGVDDDYSPGIVMRAYGPSGVVLDPCAGRGVTSRQAQGAGWVSINNELNPPRVSAALTRMAKLIEEEPVRVR